MRLRMNCFLIAGALALVASNSYADLFDDLQKMQQQMQQLQGGNMPSPQSNGAGAPSIGGLPSNGALVLQTTVIPVAARTQ